MLEFTPPERRRIFLMRHGSVTYFAHNGAPFDPLSVALDAEGREQADAAGRMFANQAVRFDRVITSGLARTVETASRVLAAADHPPIELETWSELEEIRGGRLSAIADEDLRQAFLGAFEATVAEDTRFLGGESVGQLMDRVLPAITKLRTDSSWKTVLLVLHGGVNRVILSHALTGSRTLLGGLSQAPACINALDVGDAERDWIVRHVNISAVDLLQPAIRHSTMEKLLTQYLAWRRPQVDLAAAFVGTKPMAQSHSFEVEALEAWARAHVPEAQYGLEVQQFKGGQSNPTYLVTARQRGQAPGVAQKPGQPALRWVMRTKPGPAAKLLPSAHAIEREFRIQKALADTDVPVAKMVALCEEESVIGRAFYWMEHVEGRVLWNPALPGLANRERAAIFDDMNRVIAALHEVDYSALGLSDYGRPGNYFERQIARWTKQYRASETEKIEAMDALIDWLPAHIPEGDETSIVHGDFRLDNLIFAQDEPRIIAVLDWELSTLGHPLADFSYNAMAWHLEPDVFRGMAGLDLAALGIPSEQAYVNRYLQRTQRAAFPAQTWRFYMAFNLFRLAGILQGIAKRAAEGIASSAQATQSGRRARPLAELGWRTAQGQSN
jgi:aminoglycoside phosphotransferase (APT) family kinase protein/broad specificity phosphatase PhoE